MGLKNVDISGYYPTMRKQSLALPGKMEPGCNLSGLTLDGQCGDTKVHGVDQVATLKAHKHVSKLLSNTCQGSTTNETNTVHIAST